jgi:homoserine O-acetyltransferase
VPTETLSTFQLESGAELHGVPVQYRTWGQLNERRDNAVVVCHALTGSADATQWWGDLLGSGRAFDPEDDFVICLNAPGSPYGSVSPITENPATGAPYGADFPRVTIRDTVRLHRRVLTERLGVRSVRLAAGGSMGGMQVLEWAFEEKDDGAPLVQSLAPVAVGGRHAPWQIGWSEAQRQAIYADPDWQDGRYVPGEGPTRGLAAARMMAMISYRSYSSYQERFGRDRMTPDPATASAANASDAAPPPERQNGEAAAHSVVEDAPFAIESYLRHQGEKLIDRFDARCYVALTRQMDSHDVSRGRGAYEAVLRSIEQPALIVSIDSDALYPPGEQRELTEHLPNAQLDVLSSPHGHDAFLIETQTLSKRLRDWRRV